MVRHFEPPAADSAGHYIASVFDPAQDQWYKCDDETCEAQDAIGAFTPKATTIILDSDDDQSTEKRGGSPSPKSPPKCARLAALRADPAGSARRTPTCSSTRADQRHRCRPPR